MVPALVLAAGLGSRIRPIAGDLPKPLVPFGGRAILAHNLRWLAAAGVSSLWINLHFQADLIRDAVGDGSAFGLSVAYLDEPELLGTAGALGSLRGRMTGTMLIVYGDNIIRCNLARFLAAHRDSGAEATVALFDRDRHAHTGIAGGRVVLGAGDRISSFVEGGAAEGCSLVNAGVYAVEPSILDLIPPGRLVDFGRDVFPAMLAAGRALNGYVIEADGFCLGLDTPESYAVGQSLLDQGKITLP